MRIKGITDEDFLNYKVPSMYICSSTCDFKCDKESGMACCQNSALANQPSIDLDDDYIILRYLSNKITKAIVIAGLEPFDQAEEVIELIASLRGDFGCNDDVVIYTGYNPGEVKEIVEQLSCFGNVIVKFGRFIPGSNRKYDSVLGVWLASPNQFGKKL